MLPLTPFVSPPVSGGADQVVRARQRVAKMPSDVAAMIPAPVFPATIVLVSVTVHAVASKPPTPSRSCR